MCDRCSLYKQQYKDMEMYDIMQSKEPLQFPFSQVRIISRREKGGWHVESVVPKYCPECGERIDG